MAITASASGSFPATGAV